MTTMKKRLTGLFLFIFLLAGALEFSAWAQTPFPTKSISLVVPFAAGGAVDSTIRILASEAEKILGQKLLIINKPGGGAAEGQGFVARAKPDGYTLLAMTSSLVTNTLTKKVDFTINSFEPIMLYCMDPEVMLVYSKAPFQNLEDMIQKGKKEPITHATPGHSTSHHLASLILEKKSGVKFKYIHTKGGAEQTPMVAGGHAQCGLGGWGPARSMVEQGNLRVLGVMSEERDPRFPDVPTFKEKGWPIIYGAWRGIAAPQGTPPEILEKLYQAFQKASERPEVQQKFDKAGYPLVKKGGKEFAAFVKADYEEVKEILSSLEK